MPRKIVGGFVLLLAIFAIPVWAEEWSKTFELNGKADLRVETNDARVQVEAWERKEIQARVVSEGVRIGLWGGSDTHQVRVRDFQSGNRVELEVRIPSTNWVIGVNTRSARIELRVPRRPAWISIPATAIYRSAASRVKSIFPLKMARSRQIHSRGRYVPPPAMATCASRGASIP